MWDNIYSSDSVFCDLCFSLLIFPEHSQNSEERVHDNVHPSPTIDTSILKNRMKHIYVYHRDAFISCQSARLHCRYIFYRCVKLKINSYTTSTENSNVYNNNIHNRCALFILVNFSKDLWRKMCITIKLQIQLQIQWYKVKLENEKKMKIVQGKV